VGRTPDRQRDAEASFKSRPRPDTEGDRIVARRQEPLASPATPLQAAPARDRSGGPKEPERAEEKSMAYETREDGQLIWTNPRTGRRYCRDARQPNNVSPNRYADVLRWSGLTDHELRLAIDDMSRRASVSRHVSLTCQASDALSDALGNARAELAARR